MMVRNSFHPFSSWTAIPAPSISPMRLRTIRPFRWSQRRTGTGTSPRSERGRSSRNPTAASNESASLLQTSSLEQGLEARLVVKIVIHGIELELMPDLRLIEVLLEFVERFLFLAEPGVAFMGPVTEYLLILRQ